MKLATLIKRLKKESDYWQSRGWDDPSISEIFVDVEAVTITFCARKYFDRSLCATVHKKPSRYITLRGRL